MSIYIPETKPNEEHILGFKPTTLYIKTHNVTRLKYFGKTIAEDVHNYKGSGTHWSKHIKKHGNLVTTTIFGHYTNIYELVEAALKFSYENNIVESEDWANLVPENGLGGCVKGHLKGVGVGDKNNNWNNRWNDKQRLTASIKQTGINRGKTYEELYGKEKSDLLKEKRRKIATGKNNSGKNNPRAKSIKATSPDNIEYLILGNISGFCKEHKLGLSRVNDCYLRNKPHRLGWKFELF